MNKMFKKSIAVLIAVLMIVTSLPFTAITAQAASSTQTINVTNGNYYGTTFQRNPQTLDFIGFGGFSVTNLLLVQSNKFIVSFSSSSVLWV